MQRHAYDVQRMLEDMAVKGVSAIDVARAQQIAPSTVTRFLNGQRQTAKTAKLLADALGYSVRRYIVSATKPTARPAIEPVISAELPSPVGDRRHSDADRRLGGRRRSNRDVYPDRRKEARR